MSTKRRSANYAGLFPVTPSDELPILSSTLENDRFPNAQPPLPKRASRALSRFLIAFCIGVAATLAWQSYGDAARKMVATSYPQLGWLAPQGAITAQKTADTIALAGSAATDPDQRQLDAVLGALHATRLSLDRIAAGQDLITRSIDEIATRIATGQELTRKTDETATSIAARQEPTTRSTNQTAGTVATGQEQMTRNTGQTAASIDQPPSETNSIPVESQGDAASLRPTARLSVKPTEAKQPQTLSEKGKPLSATSGHDASCFPSASAVLQNRPAVWPTWTLKAPGHEGTMCWYASARPRGSGHRPGVSGPTKETAPEKEIGTNGRSAPRGAEGGGTLGYPNSPTLEAQSRWGT